MKTLTSAFSPVCFAPGSFIFNSFPDMRVCGLGSEFDKSLITFASLDPLPQQTAFNLCHFVLTMGLFDGWC